MKIITLIAASFLLCAASLHAGVIVTPGRITVQGRLEGDQFLGTSIGETLDYLTFEVTARTSVRLIGTDLTHSVFLAMAHVELPSLFF